MPQQPGFQHRHSMNCNHHTMPLPKGAEIKDFVPCQQPARGGLQVVALGGQVVVMGHQGGELTGLVKSGTKEPGDLLDEGVGSQEGVIALGQLLDLLLVLVQLLQIVGSHAGDALGLGLVAMLLISKNADLELLLGDVTQLDGAGETLVLLGIV